MSGLAQSNITACNYASHSFSIHRTFGLFHEALLSVKCAFFLRKASMTVTSHRHEL